MKSKTKALLVVPVLVISLSLALLMIPGHGARDTRLVLAAGAAAAQWPNTEISTLRLRSPVHQVAIFYGTGETVYTEVGENIDEIRVAVNIANTYASSASEAMAYTKVHVTISHPTAGTVFSGWLTVIDASPWTDFYNVSFENHFTQHTLVAGTYTITTIYQVYA